MDRAQHQRYLVYLKKYEYFGRGKPRLVATAFAANVAELESLPAHDATSARRRAQIEALLLRD
jgi:hypothetical protein